MNKKYPLLLQPLDKPYIWGSELWSLSCHPAGTCAVVNGPEAGRPLTEVLADWGYTNPFPWLIKIINAKNPLSVQVHPDDAYAARVENQQGKTEMWYILDADEGASLIYGFNQTLSLEEFEQHIKNGTLGEAVCTVPVQKGDVFFIPAGTLHAIGAGLKIAEIQQSSDVTYRVWDYDRTDAQGNKRPLHIEKALEVTDRVPATVPYGQPQGDVLADCDKFHVEKAALTNEPQPLEAEKLCALLVTEGALTLTYGEETITAAEGQSILLPPQFPCTVSGNGQFIKTT